MNRPINLMTTDDMVRAWVGDRRIKVALDSRQYGELVADCEKSVASLKERDPKGRSRDAARMASASLLTAWCARHAIPFPAVADSFVLADGLAALAGWKREDHADPVPGEFGTPYSVTEARLYAAETPGLDQYARDLMLWLCDEVDSCRRDLEVMRPSPLPKEKVLRDDGRLGHLFLSSLVATFPVLGKDDARLKPILESDRLTLVLLANGVPLDAAKACEEWERQTDRIVREAAAELVAEKVGEELGKVEEVLAGVRRAIMDKMERAGIPLPKEE